MNRQCWTRTIGAIGLALGALGACNAQVSEGGSETNWLGPCQVDADCIVGSCVCGRCSETCTEGTRCPEGLDTCAGNGSEAFATFCGAASPRTGVCTTACDEGNACRDGFECRGGACVPEMGEVTSGTFFSRSISWRGGSSAAVVGACMPRSLEPNAAGNTPCSVIAARAAPCSCTEPGLSDASPKGIVAARDYLRRSDLCGAGGTTLACEDLCLCTVSEMTGSDGQACVGGSGLPLGVAGWCYVDPGDGIGSPTVIERCKLTEPQMFRFAAPTPEDWVFVVACVTSAQSSARVDGANAPLSAACTPSDHTRPDFGGFSASEVQIESGSADCASGACLTAYFQGRLGCTFGTPEGLGTGPTCLTTGPDPVPVTAPVTPQFYSRSPAESVYCSCQCAGPGPGPFCSCPDGFECARLIPDYGLGTDIPVGSYCAKAGSVPQSPDDIVTAPCLLSNGVPSAGCAER